MFYSCRFALALLSLENIAQNSQRVLFKAQCLISYEYDARAVYPRFNSIYGALRRCGDGGRRACTLRALKPTLGGILRFIPNQPKIHNLNNRKCDDFFSEFWVIHYVY